jgi:16S rRNA (adenine1518-N6/adenine1519-N6)-dimethyltransferase
VVQAAFGQRRKTLRKALASLGGEKLLKDAGIDPMQRAEQLSIEEFGRLSVSYRTRAGS